MSTRRLTAMLAAFSVAAGSAGLASAAPQNSRDPVVNAPCASPGKLVDGARDSVLTFRRWVARLGFYACYRGHDAIWLGTSGDEGGVIRPRLGGPYVGYGRRSCDKESCGGRTVIRDLRSKRAADVVIEGAVDRTYATVLTSPRGFVAWSFRIEPTAGGGGEVHVLRIDGTHEQLDAGAGVDPSSLALAGRRLTWVRDGMTASHVE